MKKCKRIMFICSSVNKLTANSSFKGARLGSPPKVCSELLHLKYNRAKKTILMQKKQCTYNAPLIIIII